MKKKKKISRKNILVPGNLSLIKIYSTFQNQYLNGVELKIEGYEFDSL